MDNNNYLKSKREAVEELRQHDVKFDYAKSCGLSYNITRHFNEAYINYKLKKCKLYKRNYKYRIIRVFQCSNGRFYELH